MPRLLLDPVQALAGKRPYRSWKTGLLRVQERSLTKIPSRVISGRPNIRVGTQPHARLSRALGSPPGIRYGQLSTAPLGCTLGSAEAWIAGVEERRRRPTWTICARRTASAAAWGRAEGSKAKCTYALSFGRALNSIHSGTIPI